MAEEKVAEAEEKLGRYIRAKVRKIKECGKALRDQHHG